MSEPTTQQTQADIGSQRVARVYAEALLNVGWSRHQAQEMLDDLDAMVNRIYRGDEQLTAFLGGKAIDEELKAGVIRRAFEGRVRDDFLHFLLVLNEHGRLDLLAPILSQYRELYDERQNRIQVRVVSAAPLSPEQLERVKETLRRIMKREPMLESSVDPALMGGVIVRVGDYVYDGSVRTRLENLRYQLIENSSHEIQSGRDRFSS
jgi:F-type H+-transporting ATPase subunit delta